MKRRGFMSLECVISMTILIFITYIISHSINNSINLLNKNENKLRMLLVAKEEIEDERDLIKNNSSVEIYNKSYSRNDYLIEKSVRDTSFYKCYNLKVKISSNDSNMELNTYVTKE